MAALAGTHKIPINLNDRIAENSLEARGDTWMKGAQRTEFYTSSRAKSRTDNIA